MNENKTKYLIIAQKLTYLYLFIMFSVFLFWFTNFYYNITYSKYIFFCSITLVFLTFVFVFYALHLYTIKKLSPKKKWREVLQLRKTDYLIIYLLMSYIITTFLSEYGNISLWGYVRHTGLIFYFLLAGAYFMVSRFYLQQQSIILTFLCSVSVVILLGVLQFFYVDIFGFLEYVSDYQGNLYLSTIGNINFFSSLICLSMPLSIVLFIICKEIRSKVLYGFFVVICSLGLLISNSDSGYFGMFFIFIIVLFFSLNNIKYFQRYIISVLLFLSTFKIFGIIIRIFKLECRNIHSFSYFITYRTITLVILMLMILLYLYIRVNEDFVVANLKTIKKIVYIGVLICIIISCTMVFYFSVVNTKANLGNFGNYLRYNNDWGTGRGMIWNKVIYCFSQLPFIQIIFGHGLDTTCQLLTSQFGDSMLRYDNAHNELIQYLVTTGISGLILYLNVFYTTIKRAMSKLKKDPYVFALMCTLIGYLLQSIFNINQPITTPLLYIFLGIIDNFTNQ